MLIAKALAENENERRRTAQLGVAKTESQPEPAARAYTPPDPSGCIFAPVVSPRGSERLVLLHLERFAPVDQVEPRRQIVHVYARLRSMMIHKGGESTTAKEGGAGTIDEKKQAETRRRSFAYHPGAVSRSIQHKRQKTHPGVVLLSCHRAALAAPADSDWHNSLEGLSVGRGVHLSAA